MNKKLFLLFALYFFNANSYIDQQYLFIKMVSDLIFSFTKNIHANRLAATPPPSPAAAGQANQHSTTTAPARPGSGNYASAAATASGINYKELEKYLSQRFKNSGESKKRNCPNYIDYQLITNECKNLQHDFSLYYRLYQYTKTKTISSVEINTIETMIIQEIRVLEDRVNKDYELFSRLENESWSSDLHIPGHYEFRYEFKENRKQLEYLRKTYKAIFNKAI